MLRNIDVNRKISKQDFKARINKLEMKLARLQRRCVERELPLLMVFEGWDAAGKGTLINRLILPLDPRGFSVYSAFAPNQEEALRPFLWRYAVRTPAKGRIVIWDRCWYRRTLEERIEPKRSRAATARDYEDINAFERQLTDHGTVLIKFFLHIDKRTQKQRFRALENDPAMSWRVTDDDWERHKQYRQYLGAAEEMLTATDSETAPWHIVEARQERFAAVKIFEIVTDTLQRHLRRLSRKQPSPPTNPPAPRPFRSSVLRSIDLDKSMERKHYKKELEQLQWKFREQEHLIYRRRIPVVIVYEGSDAAGKGGNIRRLTQRLDPRGYEVIPIAAPTPTENAHHYLWRFWKQVPKAGHIAIFDRSWYGRVLVERVEGFCSPAQWRRAYRELNEMERHWHRAGIVLYKFWLQISPEEQLIRFQQREKTPHKRWKITEEDWRNREKLDHYQPAVDEMLYRTGTPYAPWTVVESNCKWFARIKVLRTVTERLDTVLSS